MKNAVLCTVIKKQMSNPLKIGDKIMKKMMIMAMMMTIAISANAMSYNAAKHEALFLSDKMAYELNLTAAQYDAVYEINLDYLMSVNGHADVFGPWWDRRNADLHFVLTAWQFEKYMRLTYFYRPISWHNGTWTFHVYSHYDRGRFFNHHPKVYGSYKGGHNRKPSHFYADRRVAKPAPAPAARPHNTPKHDNARKGDRHVAQNTHGNHASGKFAGRR